MNIKSIEQLYDDIGVDFGGRCASDFEAPIKSEDLLDYVASCLPNRSIFISRVYLLSAQDIQGFCKDEALYSFALYRNGFLPIAQSMSTDLLGVDVNDGRVVWFDRNNFIDGIGSLVSHEKKEVEANRENLESVGIYICPFSEMFLVNLIKGNYDSLFSLLD